MKKKIKIFVATLTLCFAMCGLTGCMYIDGNDGQWHSWGPNCNDPNFTGMDCNEYGWWYFQNGVIDWNYTGMACNEWGWWYFKNGQIDWGYTGMACNQYGWWYYQNGRLDWGYNGFGFNEYGGWLYQNGTIAWNYTGDYGNYYIKGGHLDHKHSYITKNAKNATCSQNGYTGDTVCKHCGKVAKRGSSIAKLNHNYETRNAKEATCTQNGYTGDKVCKNCGYISKGNITAQKLHNPIVNIAEKEPTTTESGCSQGKICKDCGTLLEYSYERRKLINYQNYDKNKVKKYVEERPSVSLTYETYIPTEIDVDLQTLYTNQLLEEYLYYGAYYANYDKNITPHKLYINNNPDYTQVGNICVYNSKEDAINEVNEIKNTYIKPDTNKDYYINFKIWPYPSLDNNSYLNAEADDLNQTPFFAKGITKINIKNAPGIEIVSINDTKGYAPTDTIKEIRGKCTGYILCTVKVKAQPSSPYYVTFPTLTDGQVLNSDQVCPLNFVYDTRNGNISRYSITIVDLTTKEAIGWGNDVNYKQKTMKISKDHQYQVTLNLKNKKRFDQSEKAVLLNCNQVRQEYLHQTGVCCVGIANVK